ncbi:hypothetical protein MNBD_IGNAVI01-1725 [hydrothermal vent metagenome]|uniref:Phage shock protein PspC N-terminal domain-containing protein n=1 Tax=hydrothermal vent metagenome TaxID=652676 RepID=A0A3B1CZ56_9ZZZZ
MQNTFDEKPKPEKGYNLFDDDVPYEKKRLLRSKDNRIFFGVCGGLAEYYEVSKTLVRLLFAIAVMFGGLGAAVYLILLVFTPSKDPKEKIEISHRAQHKNAKALFGIVLITVGLYSIILPTNFFPLAFIVYIPMKAIAPIIFLAAGVWIQKYYRSGKNENLEHKFYRPTRGRLLMGVCAGLAEYLGAYVIVVRLLFVVFAFATMGIGVLLYFLIAYLSKQKSVVTIEQ